MDSELHQRLAAAAGKRTYRRLGELTGTHPETVRRYMQGQAPSAEFLAALCSALGLNGSWLLTGHGPLLLQDVRSDALGQADAAELLTAVSNTLTQLIDRVEELEVFVQTLDTRIRAAGTLAGSDGRDRAVKPGPVANGRSRSERPQATRLGDRVGDAVAQRAPAAAD
ncbi:MAG: hypothetical protein DHS20C14_19030 [Phycisphaeraceae bacterium]|nr:MAG: hypothetical protein DHS20C14_19030 [Phycisphaeraceae bacterium]